MATTPPARRPSQQALLQQKLHTALLLARAQLEMKNPQE
jgi:hypothetical protein